MVRPVDGAAPTTPVNATRKAKKKRRPREFMARKFQTYARPSTTNAPTERRGYNSVYVYSRCSLPEDFGHYDNLPFGGGNNLREILTPICGASKGGGEMPRDPSDPFRMTS